MRRLLLVVLLGGCLISTAAQAEVFNVASHADVQLKGGTFFAGDYGDGYVSAKETIVDGIFLPWGRVWDQGSVWWTSAYGQDNSIELSLGGTFKIESFIVQADDNDGYELYYRDLSDNAWKLAWYVPNYDSLSWGMTTRPSVADNQERYMLPAPITTDALMFKANWADADGYVSVSEIQAFGSPVAGVIEVAIDIKPGETPNSINRASNGLVTVAVLSTPDFDAGTIDPGTVMLASAPAARKRNGELMAALEDVNGDGLQDMVVHIHTDALLLSDTDTEAVLEGKTASGLPIKGKDSVRIVK